MDKDKIKQKSMGDINRIAVRCLRIMIYFLLIFYIALFFMGHGDQFILTLFMGVCVFVTLIPCIVVPAFKLYESRITYHLIIIATVVVCVLFAMELNNFAYPMIIFPILLASLYYNRTFVLYTALLLSIGIMISSVFEMMCPDMIYMTGFANGENIVTHMTLPLLIMVIFMSFISFYIVNRNSLMMDKYIDTAITMTENEKALIFAFSEISENKSKMTGEHIKRVAAYMKVLGRASGFDEDYCDKLATAAMMHDIGKLMISEEILEKPGRLTDEEYMIMKSHVLYGEALLKDCPGEMMQLAAVMAKEHHERWDGRGYLGMKGEEIAYISRLLAVCDVFDALTASRSYKKGWSLEKTYNEIVKNSGTQFDPEAVRLFVENFDSFIKIHDSLPDQQIK